jgi:hypothetical protein
MNPFQRRGAGVAQPRSAFAGRVQIATPLNIRGDGVNAINFSERSAEARKAMIGLPPHYFTEEARQAHENLQQAQNAPLPRIDQPAAIGSEMVYPEAMYVPQFYGDAIVFPVVFAAAGERLVLTRPNAIRTSLLIVNSTVVGNIFYTFDRVADNVSCVPIIAGGNRLFDFSVPQGELHIFAAAAGTVIIEYMNRDIKQESYR